MKTKSEIITQFRQKRKRDLISLYGGKCSLCGYNKSIKALEFHHIKPQDKKYALGTGNCHKLQDDLTEAKKCLLVCANCHREIHDGFYNDVNLFDYQKINNQIEIEKLSISKNLFCKDCGVQITIYSKSGYCNSCAQKHRAKVKNKPSREELKSLIRTLPFLKIATIYNVSDNAIRKWCDKYSLPRNKKDINNYSDAQWLKI